MANEELTAALIAISPLIPKALIDRLNALPEIPEEIAGPVIRLETPSPNMGLRQKMKNIKVLYKFQRDADKWAKNQGLDV